MSEIKVSVVIVNYNVKDLLLTCIQSLFTFHPNSSIEIIVVDNNSKDGSCAAIRERFPEVIVIENKDNAGFPKANNQGFAIAKGEYIFMLNPDTEFKENSISILSDYLDNNPEISLVGPKLLNTDGSLQTSVWRNPSVLSVFCESFYLTSLLKKKYYKDKSFNEPFEAETFSGAAIFFRIKVLDQIGGLDETMFWIEDVEFCYRAIQNGMKCVYLPSTKILHHIGQSAKKNYNISISNQIFNKIKFFRKHHSFIEWLAIMLISIVLVVLKIIVFGLLSPMNVVYARKAKAYLYTFPKMFNPPDGIA